MKSKNSNPAREALKAISTDIKNMMKAGTLPLFFQDCLTINECLQRGYEMETGQTDWSTFKGWKDRGYFVQKGEKGFPLWSRPKNKRDEDKKDLQEAETEEEKKGSGKFWVAYIFHAGQVANAAGERPSTYAKGENLRPLLPDYMERELAIISGRHVPTPETFDPEVEILEERQGLLALA